MLETTTTTTTNTTMKTIVMGDEKNFNIAFTLPVKTYTRVKLLGSGGQGNVTLVKIEKRKKKKSSKLYHHQHHHSIDECVPNCTPTTTSATSTTGSSSTTTTTDSSSSSPSNHSQEHVIHQQSSPPHEEEEMVIIEKFRALKRIFCVGLDQLNLALREAQSVLQIGSHPNIVKCYNFFIERSEHVTNRGLENITTIENECVCIMYEYCEKGSLADVIRSKRTCNKIIPWNTVLDFFKQILRGIQFIHQNNICHRDMVCF